MTTATVTILVDPSAAEVYAAASVEDQRKIQLLLSLRLSELTSKSEAGLKAEMNELAQRAETRGLTDSILNSLLKG